MKKKKGLFFGAIVFAAAVFLHFMSLKMADLASGDELLEIVDRGEEADGAENADDAGLEGGADDAESPGILPAEEYYMTDLGQLMSKL